MTAGVGSPPRPSRGGPAMPADARIVILGAGFAALKAIREIRRRAPGIRLTLVAPAPESVYQPSLIWIPTGLRDAEALRMLLEGFPRRARATFLAARAMGLADRGEVPNDGLIIATGGRFIRKLPGIEHAHVPCAGTEAAQAIREQLVAMDRGRLAFGFGANPHEPAAMRGGPVFELLFGIDT